jgi:hypothetical protein
VRVIVVVGMTRIREIVPMWPVVRMRVHLLAVPVELATDQLVGSPWHDRERRHRVAAGKLTRSLGRLAGTPCNVRSLPVQPG